MTALLITLGSIATYFGIGWWVAVWDMPHLYERSRTFWEVDPLEINSKVSSEVRGMSTVTLLLWPFRLPYLAMAHTSDKRDPARLEQEIRERDAKIRELERNLRIGR